MGWYGLFPPQSLYLRRKFRGVVLDPPNFNPGSWCGAGKMWLDEENKEYWLTSRPREGAFRRGYAVEIYRSADGWNYGISARITKEELSGMLGVRVQSIENQQLLRDPSTGDYHLYLSVDVAGENFAGSEKETFKGIWETCLLSSDDPSGPWKPEGFALRADMGYDNAEARDPTIDIVDGRYFCIYKARSSGSALVHAALATSADGKSWVKQGILKVDGLPPPDYFLLSGSILPGSLGLTFLGVETLHVVKGAALSDLFMAYRVDCRDLNLERLFSARWVPGSKYEHETYPIHTYAQILPDLIRRDRWLIWIEAVDPIHSREPGLNSEVDRVLLYECEARALMDY